MRVVLAMLGVADYVLDRSLCSLLGGENAPRQAGLPLPCDDREESGMRPARTVSGISVAGIHLPSDPWHPDGRLP